METTRLFIKLTRWNDWILNLLVVAAGYVISRPVIGESLGNLILFIIAFFLFESFGFAINDYFDAKSDSKNPKTKNLIAMGLIKKSHAMIFCILLSLAIFALCAILLPLEVSYVVLAIYIVFVLYSCPPFRFKEKFILDISVHGIFMSFLFAGAYIIGKPDNMNLILLAIPAFFISSIVCTTHEMRDIKSDKKSMFKTTAIKLGYQGSLKLVRAEFIMALLSFIYVVLFYMPHYMLLFLLAFTFYAKVLFSDIKQDEFFQKSIQSCNRSIVALVLIGLALAPFYLGLI